VACEQCFEAWDAENIEPPCFSDQRDGEEADPGVNACWIPDITDVERRIIDLRNRLVSLGDLGIGSEILRMYDADIEDIELMAVIEDELKAIQDEKKGTNG
jgi:hypothetical protein